MRRAMVIVGLCSAIGCMESLENQVKKEDGPVIGKTTQAIGEFNPADGKAVVKPTIQATDPITAPVAAYGPMVQRLSENEIAYALRLYEAEHGKYPATYDEFMEKIIKANNIRLPVLPGGKKYEYDVANHALVVVDAPNEGE